LSDLRWDWGKDFSKDALENPSALAGKGERETKMGEACEEMGAKEKTEEWKKNKEKKKQNM